MERQLNIFDLPLEILILICNRLKDFNDKLNFAKLHLNLWNAFVSANRKDVGSKLYFKAKESTSLHWEFMLQWWGPDVTSIINDNEDIDAGDLLQTVAKFCPNVELLHFGYYKDNLYKIEKYLSKLTMIKDLKVLCKFCEILQKKRFILKRKWNFEPRAIEINLGKVFDSVHGLSNLRKLDLGDHNLRQNEGVELNNLTQLEELKIGYLDADAVSYIAKLLEKLRKLAVVVGYRFGTRTLINLANYCVLLEELILNEHDKYFGSTPYTKTFDRKFASQFRIPYFRKLTSLHICKASKLTGCVRFLEFRYNNQLQVLKIPEITINNKEAKRISELQALKVLHCSTIKSDSVERMSRTVLEELHCPDTLNLEDEDIFNIIRNSRYLKLLNIASISIRPNTVRTILDILDSTGVEPIQPLKIHSTFSFYSDRENIKLMLESNQKSKRLLDLRLI